MSEVVSAIFDPESATSGIQEVIDTLGERGGHVRIPAGEWRLRRSVVLPGRVSLVGDGPATKLTINPPRALRLACNVRKGSRSVCVRGRVPFTLGDGVGVFDRPHQWWDGTHTMITSIDGSLVRLSQPLKHGLTVKGEAQIVGFFPGITAVNSQDLEVRDLMIQGSRDPEGPWWQDFTYSAVHLVYCYGVRVLNVTVWDWPCDGISVQGGSDVQVTHCQVRFCRGHGFHPGTNLERSIWSHNIGISNGGDGLYFCGHVRNSTCSDSVFTGNALSGIGGVGHGDDHHNIISNNVCSENGRWGINASDGVEHLITGNVLRSNSRENPGTYSALRLYNVQRFLVKGNRCADDQDVPTQTRGIVESGNSDWNLISGNLCVGMAEPITAIGSNSRSEGNLP